MRLGIFGDSFVELAEEGWPVEIAKKFYTDNYGKSGTSIWFSFEKFIDHYNKYTHIIFGYTNPDRIHHLPRHLIGYNYLTGMPTVETCLLNHIKDRDLQELKPIWQSYHTIFTDRFNNYLYQKMFDDINETCKNNNIRLINLMPFELCEKKKFIVNVDNRNGPCITSLMEISLNEAKYLTNQPDNRCNHLLEYNHNILLSTLLEEINSSNNEIIITKNNINYKK